MFFQSEFIVWLGLVSGLVDGVLETDVGSYCAVTHVAEYDLVMYPREGLNDLENSAVRAPAALTEGLGSIPSTHVLLTAIHDHSFRDLMMSSDL